jgi:hypothetical protein
MKHSIGGSMAFTKRYAKISAGTICDWTEREIKGFLDTQPPKARKMIEQELEVIKKESRAVNPKEAS